MARNDSRRQDSPRQETLSPSDVRLIIVDGHSETLVAQARVIGQDLAKARLEMTQIRNIFGEVRQIEMNWPRQVKNERDQEKADRAYRQLLLLKPKLAYQASRKRTVAKLQDALVPAIDAVEHDRKRFQNFVDFFEAILGYYTDKERR